MENQRPRQAPLASLWPGEDARRSTDCFTITPWVCSEI
jgi:hypothetical protein